MMKRLRLTQKDIEDYNDDPPAKLVSQFDMWFCPCPQCTPIAQRDHMVRSVSRGSYTPSE